MLMRISLGRLTPQSTMLTVVRRPGWNTLWKQNELGVTSQSH